jgi:hypothetical protein
MGVEECCHRQSQGDYRDGDGGGREVDRREDKHYDETEVPLLGGMALVGTEEQPCLEVVEARNLAGASSCLDDERRVPTVRGEGGRQRLPPKGAFPPHSSNRSRSEHVDKAWSG